MRRLYLCMVMVICFIGVTAELHPTEAVRIKIATKAPENFKSAQIMKEMTNEIAAKTNNAVEFKIYYGGVKGTGQDVFLKIQNNEIQGGEFTAGEASQVCKDLNVMSIPLSFANHDEVKYVFSKLSPEFESELEKQGFKVLGWLDLGFAYFMSMDQITSLADMKGKKVWIPQGDGIGKTTFEAMGVPPIPMNIADVMVALQTGQLNSVANSFVGALALQWHTKVKYTIDNPLLYIYGLVMITKEAYDQIPAEHLGTVTEITQRYFKQINDNSQNDNLEARKTMEKQGIVFSPLATDKFTELENIMTGVKQKLGEESFDKVTLEKMQQYLTEYRSAQAK